MTHIALQSSIAKILTMRLTSEIHLLVGNAEFWEGGRMRIRSAVCAVAFLAVSTADASAFSMSFRWCGLSSPVFSLSGVPKETTTLQFHMVDLDVPSYNHGGGTVAYKGQSTVACGALTNYSPPSPPSGSHSYQITATAFGSGNVNLGTASFTRKFPEK